MDSQSVLHWGETMTPATILGWNWIPALGKSRCHMFLCVIIYQNSTWNELHMCTANVWCQELTKVKFFLVLSFPVFLSLSLLIFPLIAFCESSIWAICWHGLAAVWHERNQWHTTLHLLLVLQKDLEGGKVGCGAGEDGESTAGKRAEGQKLKPENQVPKSKWWCVFFTQLFFSLPALLLSVATIPFLFESYTLVD